MSLISDALAKRLAGIEAERKTALPLFSKLLKDRFGIDALPDAVEITINDTRIRYLNPRELSVMRQCPKCEFTVWTDGMKNIADLGRELATRPIPAHNVRKDGKLTAEQCKQTR